MVKQEGTVGPGGPDGEGLVLDHPPLLEAIAADPLLRDLKLVAWVGDPSLLPRGGQRGFPHGGLWLERNTRFTRDFLQFLGEGRHGKASAIATRSLPRGRAFRSSHFP